MPPCRESQDRRNKVPNIKLAFSCDSDRSEGVRRAKCTNYSKLEVWSVRCLLVTKRKHVLAIPVEGIGYVMLLGERASELNRCEPQYLGQYTYITTLWLNIVTSI